MEIKICILSEQYCKECFELQNKVMLFLSEQKQENYLPKREKEKFIAAIEENRLLGAIN